MKTSIRTIGVALLVLSAFVGFAAADVSEPPDAGSTWSTARSFTASWGYTSVEGTLTSSPADSVDMWKSTTPDVGDTLYVYLNSGAYNKGVAAEMFDGNHALMQRVKKGDKVHNDETLDAEPVYVKVSGSSGDGDYTFALSRNV